VNLRQVDSAEAKFVTDRLIDQIGRTSCAGGELLDRYMQGMRVAIGDVQRVGYCSLLGFEPIALGISMAIQRRNEPLAKLLIESFDAVHMHLDRLGEVVPLLEAAKVDMPQFCRWLLAKGADVDFVGASGFTPLCAAVCFSGIETVGVMLDAGADLRDGQRNGGSALSYAIKQASPEVLRLLVERGADLDAPILDGLTPLSLAAQSGHWAIPCLVSLGADPDQVDAKGLRPIDWAAAATLADGASPKEHPLVLLAEGGADLSLGRDWDVSGLDELLDPDVFRELKAVMLAKNLESAMKDIPFSGDFVDNDSNSMPRPSRSCGASPL
jgi:hypothetical protein